MMFEKDGVHYQEPLAETTLFYRCAYLVIPRSVAFAMPYDWQVRFAILMEEAREMEMDAQAELPWPFCYTIQARAAGDDGPGRFTHDELREYRSPCSEVLKLAKWSREQPFDPEAWAAYHRRINEQVKAALAAARAS